MNENYNKVEENFDSARKKVSDETKQTVDSSIKQVETLLKKPTTITIDEIAKALGKEKIEKTLPNQKVIKTLDWNPSELKDVYDFIDKYKNEKKLGINDLIIIDGGMPTWLLPVISHAFHPVYTSVNYPQGNTFIPINGIQFGENGEGENLDFNIEDKGDYTLVEFLLTQTAIDLEKTINTLVAPKIESGKPVIISGRGPIAIATGLAEAYSHIVPFVANFQPGTGAVISISHDAKNPLGKVIEI